MEYSKHKNQNREAEGSHERKTKHHSITETHLKPQHKIWSAKLHNLQKDSTEKRGGTAVLIQKHIKAHTHLPNYLT